MENHSDAAIEGLTKHLNEKIKKEASDKFYVSLSVLSTEITEYISVLQSEEQVLKLLRGLTRKLELKLEKRILEGMDEVLDFFSTQLKQFKFVFNKSLSPQGYSPSDVVWKWSSNKDEILSFEECRYLRSSFSLNCSEIQILDNQSRKMKSSKLQTEIMPKFWNPKFKPEIITRDLHIERLNQFLVDNFSETCMSSIFHKFKISFNLEETLGLVYRAVMQFFTKIVIIINPVGNIEY